LVISCEIGDRRGEGNALGSIGAAYAELGESLLAVEFCGQYLAITRELGDLLGEGTSLFNISLALDQLGDRAQAIAHAEAALEIFERIESPKAVTARAMLAQWRREV
jgi:tetratricopeptide (TPR) repeat protein